MPNLLDIVDRVLAAGADGITIHPRLDQRHIRRDDITPIARHLGQHHPEVELNIECEAHEGLIDQAIEVQAAQCTLVPVTAGETTSDHGWCLPQEAGRIRPAIERLRRHGIRVSLFANPDPTRVDAFAETGADRIEIYTGPYAWAWGTDRQEAETRAVLETAEAAVRAGLGVNAGHDLDHHNLVGLRTMTGLIEVSIGHAHICRALEVGERAAIGELKAALRR